MNFPLQRFVTIPCRQGLALLFFVTGFAAAFGAGTTEFTGHYELADASKESSFSLDITQTGSKADLSFSAAMADGSGAAPDGDGKGEVAANGILKFKFTDSFGNEGAGTLDVANGVYHLELDVTKVAESRALRFYGDVVLRKTANKPSPPS
jgi:hypothetical protein